MVTHPVGVINLLKQFGEENECSVIYLGFLLTLIWALEIDYDRTV